MAPPLHLKFRMGKLEINVKRVPDMSSLFYLETYHIRSKMINVEPSKGGLLGFASGVAALVAMKTQSEDFPIFMI